jgi:glycosyltransferase involved in cell wall biosynthesis
MDRQHISVAMSTYNGEAFVGEQLDSILAQTRPANEIVICDDGSSDGTWTILESYHRRYPELIRVYRNDCNLKPAKNFEKAISLCKNPLIALSDQDDIWRRDKLDILARRFEQKPDLGLVFSNAGLIDAEGERWDVDLWQTVGFDRRARDAIRNENALRTLLRKPVITGCTIMFCATLKAVCLPISKYLMHDYWISLVAAAHSRIDYVDKELVSYRQHTANEVGVLIMSVKQRIDRASRLGVLQCERDAAGLEELIEHLSRSVDVDQGSLKLIQKKIDFSKSRMELWSDNSPWFRGAALLARNLLQGSYGRWGNGLPTLAKDLALLLGIVRQPEFSTTHIPGTGA